MQQNYMKNFWLLPDQNISKDKQKSIKIAKANGL
jgi:hypothetical protein